MYPLFLGDVTNGRQEPLTAKADASKENGRTDARSCARTALTESQGDSRTCANPFCNAPMGALSPQGKHGRYCSDRCRTDGHVLRRAKAMIRQVGIIEFNEILKRF